MLLLMLLGCVDSWCERFNIDCVIESATVTPGADLDGDLWIDGDDCDDTNPAINPLAEEWCNDADDDCDGEVDEPSPGVVWTTWYTDLDGDGYGQDGTEVETCSAQVADQVADGGDCDDGNDTIHPGMTETCDDGVDNDCDAATTCGLSGPVAASDLTPRIYGDMVGDGAGYALAGVGDISGDGTAELLIGAPWAGDNGLVSSGRAYLAFSSYAATSGETPFIAGVSPVRFRSDTAGARLGTAVDGLVADQVLEVAVIGAPGAGGLVEGAGSALVFRSPANGIVYPEDAGGLFRGDEAGDEAGAAVAALEDYDGDGERDALVGAPGRAAGAGAAWLLLGPLSGALEENAALLEGTGAGEAAGSALLAADLDGTGGVDLVIGAPGGHAIYLLRDGEAPASLDDAERYAGTGGSAFGASLADQDLDGDGRPEILVGAPSGEFVAALSGDLVETERCTSSESGDSAGFSVSGGGDMDLDGVGDLVVGAPMADGGGAVYALYGPLAGGCVLQEEAAYSLHGDSRLGWAVLGGLQVDGASGDDLVLGNPRLQGVAADAEEWDAAGIVSLVFNEGL